MILIQNCSINSNIISSKRPKNQSYVHGKALTFTIEISNMVSGKKRYITDTMENLNRVFMPFLMKGKELEKVKNHKKVCLENKTHKALVKNLNASSFNQTNGVPKFFFEIIG